MPDVAKILTNDRAYIRDNPELADAAAIRQANRVIWVQVLEGGLAEGVFRPVSNAYVIVRSIYDGISARRVGCMERRRR